MNSRGQTLLGTAVFLGLWLIGSIVWSFWLNGIYVPTAGVVTALAGTGLLTLTININR